MDIMLTLSKLSDTPSLFNGVIAYLCEIAHAWCINMLCFMLPIIYNIIASTCTFYSYIPVLTVPMFIPTRHPPIPTLMSLCNISFS